MPPLLSNSVWQAVTVHDLTHRHYYGAKHRAFYGAVIRPLLRRMNIVFTVSEFSRQEIIEWASLSEEKVVAVAHGLDRAFVPDGDALDLGRPYVLYVGNRRIYKNVRRLLTSFARSKLASDGFMLALSGSADIETDKLASELGIQPDICYLGAISETALPAVYRGASAVAFVSLYEGFGFPIIEGMGCGIPVLTSAVSSMPEVAAGAALLVADPFDVEEITAGLVRICTDTGLRTSLRNAGLQRASQFDWETSAASYWSRIDHDD